MKIFKFMILAFSLFLSFSLMAQEKSSNKAMRTEMQAYTKTHIIPVIQTQRLKLERELSATEKQKLGEIRSTLEAKRAENQSFHQEIRKAKKDGTELTESQKAKLQQIRGEKKALMAEVRGIAQSHEATLRTLNEEMKENKLQWKEEMTAIRSKYISDEELREKRNERINKMIEQLERLKERDANSGELKKFKHRMAKMGKGKGHQHLVKRLMSPVGFLLLDPNQEFEFPKNKKKSLNTSVYPNPSSYMSQIDFDLEKSSFVKIELLDRQGNVLQTLVNEDKKKGKHVIPVDTSKLPSNIYYYKITTKLGSETKRFVKQ